MDTNPKPNKFLPALLLALSVLLLGSWGVYQGWQANNQAKQLNDQQAQVRTLSDDIARVQQLQKNQTNTIDLTFDEVGFLIRTARYQLIWRRDAQSATNLLRLADQRLQRARTVDGQELRKYLARDLTSLTAVPTVDRTGLLAQLLALADAVPSLPALSSVPEFVPLPKAIVTTEASAPFAWRETAAKIWSELQRVIVVRQHTESVQPLINQQAQQAQQARLQLLLQQAQIAVLSADESLYSTSLQSAKQLVVAAYDPGTGATKGFIEQLTALQAVAIAPTLPDIAPLEQRVNELIDQRAAR